MYLCINWYIYTYILFQFNPYVYPRNISSQMQLKDDCAVITAEPSIYIQIRSRGEVPNWGIFDSRQRNLVPALKISLWPRVFPAAVCVKVIVFVMHGWLKYCYFADNFDFHLFRWYWQVSMCGLGTKAHLLMVIFTVR